MRELIDLQKLIAQLEEQKLTEEEWKKFSNAVANISLEDRFYSERDIDFYVKINLRLINKFKKELQTEYNIVDMLDAMEMFNMLYKEQNELTPKLWYNYSFGRKEE